MATSRNPSRPRRWPRRLLISLNILLVTVLVAGVSLAGYVKWEFGRIKRVDLGNVLRGGGNDDNPGGAMNVLLVGSDNRSGLDPSEVKQFGSGALVAGQRSDTIMVLHVDPKTKQAAILSLPRDLWVPIAGTSGKSRINSAFDAGPDRLVETIRNDFNIPIDHYASVDFDSFKGIVDAIGGVQIRLDAPVRDYDPSTGQNLSGLNISQTGCVNLNGTQALSYVRSRHFQVKENGSWVSDPRSDLSRIDRQQDFIRRMIRKATASRNPLTVNSLISSAVTHLRLDTGFSAGDVLTLGRRFQSLDANQVEMMTLPTTATVIGGADVLLPKQPDAQQTIDRFLNGPPASTATGPAPAIPPGSINVRVLNGSGAPGQAGDAAAGLKDAGFVVTSTGDAKSFGAAQTTIRYATGQKDKADVIARYLGGAVQEVQDSTVRGVDAIIVTGSSYTGVNATGTTTPANTASPAAGVATSTTAPKAPSVGVSASAC